MRRVVRCVISLCALCAPASAWSSVAVHGLNHDALGAATVSSVSTATGVSCAVSNLGSSGQDGVSIDLGRTQGCLIRFGPPPVKPAPPITDCRLVAHGQANGVTTTVGSLDCSSNAATGDLDLSCDINGVSTCVVEVWNGATLVCSVARPTGAQFASFIDSGLNLCDDRYLLGLRTQRRQDDGVVHRQLECMVQLPSPVSITIAGNSFTGTEVVMRCEVPQGTPLSLTDAQLTMTCGGGGGGGGAGGSVALSDESCMIDPASKGGFPRPSSCVVTATSGVLLSASSAPGGVTLGLDGSGQPQSVRLNGLPPGEPVIGTLRCVSATLTPLSASAVSPASCTWASGVDWDPLDGTPPVSSSVSVTWTQSAPGGTWSTNFLAEDPGVVRDLQVYSGGTLLTITGSNFYSASGPPAQCRSLCMDGVCAVTLVTTGQQVTLGGASYLPDSIVAVFQRGSGEATDMTGVTISPSGPPGTPPMQIVTCAAVPASQGTKAGGRWVFAHGPRQTVSLDGNRLPVRNLGSSGEDGVDVQLDGVPSADFLFTAAQAGDADPEAIAMKVYTCDDGSCVPRTTCVCNHLRTSHNVSIQVTTSDASPQSLFLEAGGHFIPFAVADVDGDGLPDLQVSSPSGVGIAHWSYRGYSASCDRWVIDMAGPVVTIRTGPGTSVSTSHVTVWRNREHFQDGEIPTEEQFVRLNGLPPGEPVIGTLSVCSIAIDEPGVQLSDCVANGHGDTIGGMPVVETVGTMTGIGEPKETDKDCGGPDWYVRYPERLEWVSSAPTIATVSNTGTLRGYACTGTLPTAATATDYTNVEMELKGVWGSSAGDLWDMTLRTGATADSIHLRESPTLSKPKLIRVYNGGVLQTTASDVGDFACSGLPSITVGGGDLDGDGYPDVICSGFVGGTTITINGASFACDRVWFTDLTAPTVTVSSCVRKVHGIHHGDHMSNMRTAEIPAAGSTVGVPVATDDLPEFALSRPSPNPSFGVTTLRFAMRSAGRVRARVVDIAGREVTRLTDATFGAGQHELSWNGRTRAGSVAPAGIYFVRVERDGVEPQVARLTRLR